MSVNPWRAHERVFTYDHNGAGVDGSSGFRDRTGGKWLAEEDDVGTKGPLAVLTLWHERLVSGPGEGLVRHHLLHDLIPGGRSLALDALAAGLRAVELDHVRVPSKGVEPIDVLGNLPR